MAVAAEREAAPGPSAAPRPGVALTNALLVAMSIIWGANYTVVKYATLHLAPLAFNAVRVALAAVILMTIVALEGGVRLPRRDVLTLLALGVLGNCVYQVLFIEGITRTRAGTVAIVLAAGPAFMALIGRCLGVERVAARGWLGIALSLGGIALVTFGRAGEDPAQATVTGNLLVLAASLCWAAFTVLLKPISQRVDAVRVSALTMVGGAVPLTLAAAPRIRAADWMQIPPGVWGALLYSGIGALVVAYLFWYQGVRVLGPTRTGLYGNLQPVTALAVAWLALGEAPTTWQLLGIATIVAGVVLTRR
jgi:drug/metabolite transporter (DMT)-like permease